MSDASRFGGRMRSQLNLPALLLMLAVLLSGAAVHAAPDYAGQVARQLADQGYRQIEVRRSLLGKMIVTGTRPDQQREIVIDPRNGELLRDLVRRGAGAPANAGPVLSSPGQGGSSGLSGNKGRDGSDDDSDDSNGDDSDSGGDSGDSGSDDSSSDDSGSDSSDSDGGGGED